MVKVRARPGETAQQMVSRFKRGCVQEGLIKAMKKAAYYEKPSEKRRARLARSKARLRSQ